MYVWVFSNLMLQIMYSEYIINQFVLIQVHLQDKFLKVGFLAQIFVTLMLPNHLSYAQLTIPPVMIAGLVSRQPQKHGVLPNFWILDYLMGKKKKKTVSA